MKSKVVNDLYFALVCFILGITVCVVLKPNGLIANSGISYYGNFILTLLPYGLALLGTSYFFFRLATDLNRNTEANFRHLMFGLSLILVGIFLTPYAWGVIFDWIHTTLGSILFAGQLLLSGYIAFKARRDLSFSLIAITMLIAGIICAIYVPRKNGYLIEFQIVFQLLFIWLMIRYYKKTI